MIKWLLSLFSRKPSEPSSLEELAARTFRESSGLKIETDDQNAADVIATAFLSGKPVIGNVDDDGKMNMKIIGEK